MDHSRLGPIVVAVTLSMTVPEFIEVHNLDADQLRTRFHLPRTCDPAVTALTREPAASMVTVAVECRPKPAETPVERPTPLPPRQRP